MMRWSACWRVMGMSDEPIHSDCTASSTASTCPATLTLRHSRRSTPRSSIRKVERSTPRTALPYIFLILITSNRVHSGSSMSAISSNGSVYLVLKASCYLSESREIPAMTAPAWLNDSNRSRNAILSEVHPGVSSFGSKYNTTFLRRNAAIQNSPSVALAVKSGTSWSITMGIKFSPVGQYSGNPRAFFSEIASGARSDTVPAAEKCSTQSRLARPRHDRDKPRRFYEARRSYPFEDSIPVQCAYYRFSARAPACLDSRRRNRRQTKSQPV